MKTTLLLMLFLLFSTFAFGQDNSLSKTIEFYRPDYMVPIFLHVNSNTGRGSYTGNPQSKRNNFPKQITPEMNFPQDSVSLIVKPDEDAVFAGKYQGVKLYLVNTTDQEVGFSAVDYSLYIVQEALDKDGEWKAIERVPNVPCGFGKFKIPLGANEYWEFTAVRYGGEIKTKLRFRLYKERPDIPQSPIKNPIYSNEFEGNVSARQFTAEYAMLPKAY